MNYVLIFWFSIAIMFFSGLATEIVRPRINAIMKAINPKYSGKANNHLDWIRVLQAYRQKTVTKSNERILLFFHIMMNSISLIGLVFLIIALVFGPGLMEILNP